MRRLLILLALLVSTMSFAQDDSWRDSLKIARKAYANKEYAKALKYYESAQKKRQTTSTCQMKWHNLPTVHANTIEQKKFISKEVRQK